MLAIICCPYKGYTYHASLDTPQYETKSAKVGHFTFHKGSSLKSFGLRLFLARSMTESDRPMPTTQQSFPAEPLRASLSDADDRLRLNHWMLPQQGNAPRIRIRRRWIRACPQLSQIIAATRWIAARKFLVVLS